MKTIYVKTTNTCNLNCSYCYTGGNKVKRKDFDYESTSIWIRNFLFKYKEMVVVKFHGGEPLFVKEFGSIQKFVESLQDINHLIKFDITTNLTIPLQSYHIEFLEKYIYDRVIVTSYDKTDRFPNEVILNQWESNISLLKLHCFKIYVKAILSKDVISSDPKEFLDYFEKLNIDYLQLERITGSKKISNYDSEEFMINLYKEYKSNRYPFKIVTFDKYEWALKHNQCFPSPCNNRTCNSDNITINSDGSIAGCPDNWRDSYSSIYDDNSVDEILTKSNCKLSKCIMTELIKDKRCASCSYLKICGGSCYRSSFDDTGCPGYPRLLAYMENTNG